MRYLGVQNFEALLHYKDRPNTFARLYVKLLDSYEFLKLSDVARGHLMMIWLLAVRMQNKIPADHEYIAKQIHARSRIDLDALIRGGFLRLFEETASTTLAEVASNSLERPPDKSDELLADRLQLSQENGEVASNLLAGASNSHIIKDRSSVVGSKDLALGNPLSKESEKDQDQELCETASNLLASDSSFELTIDEPEIEQRVPSTAVRSLRAAPELPAIIGPRTSLAVRQQLAQVLAEVEQGTRQRITKEQARRLLAGIVIGYWTAKFNHPKALIDDKRERTVIKALRDNGDNFAELLYVFDGAAKDPYVNGEKDGTKHDDIEFLLRNRSSIERFAALSKRYQRGEPHPTAERYKAILSGRASLNGNGVHHD